MGSAKAASSRAGGQFSTEPLHPAAELALRLDHAIEAVLIALVAFIPWPLGSVHSWPEEVVICIAAVLALLFAAKLFLVPQAHVVRSWTYLPIALFLLLAMGQLIPLPHSILGAVSPNTLKVKVHLLADLPDAAAAAMPLSFDANATGHNVRMLLAWAIIFVVALNVLRTRNRIKRMLIAISTVGGLVILLALAQDLTNATKVYWTFQKQIQFALGGPFVGHNDFPLFVNLAIGAAAALLMYAAVERRSSRRHPSLRGFSEPMSPWRIAAVVALLAVIVLGTGAVFLSLSRSGLVALGAATLCIAVTAGIRWRLNLERWLVGACALACLVVSFYFASSSVINRLATLKDPLGEYVDRWQILKDILAAWPQFPLLGTGLGTHLAVYPMFEHLHNTANFDYAENEYAQMLEETGAIGLAMVLFFIGLIVAAFFRAVKKSTHSPIGAASFGLGLGLLAVVLQSAFGFGAHLPANAVLIAIVCALLLNVERVLRGKAAPPLRAGETKFDADESRGAALSPAVKWAIVIVVGVLFVPAILAADRARRAEAEWEPVQLDLENLSATPTPMTDARLADVLLATQMAHHAEPDNVKYFYWQAMCGWWAVERRHNPKDDPDVRDPADKAQAKRLVEEFNAIRKLTPAYEPALAMAGELRYSVLDDPAGLDLIRRAASVASTDPAIFFTIGGIDCDNGDFAGAMEAFRHYLSIHGLAQGSFDKLLRPLVIDGKRPDLALELAGDDPARQLAIVASLRTFADRPDFQAMASDLEKKASIAQRRQLIERCAAPDADQWELANLADIYAAEHDLNDAITCYQRALAKDYGNVQWHLALAQTLLANGQKQQAMDEAGVCLRLHPEMPEARKLISDATSPTTRAGEAIEAPSGVR